jgi:uncharacterized membrane protein YdjX (TVP38/TMEM64 family)
MVENLIQLFREYQHLAVVISIFLSIIIAVLGVVPSVFITAANILFFGFWNGLSVSFLGEAIGACIAFLLYRAGFKKPIQKKMDKYPRVKKLLEAEDKEAFYLVIALRLVPYVPSGLITFTSAVGKISFFVFIAASSLGKLPALFIEAYTVNEVTEYNWQGKLILILTAAVLLYWLIIKKK